jgi:hypothetical protein
LDAGLAVGDEVEARFNGGTEWFPGVITGIHGDGSVSIDYDDGDQESSVSALLVRARFAESGKSDDNEVNY